MAITMKELAYMAGVSRATVDRVLNKRGRVNTGTEERISALAEKMGYQPNLAAKSLAKRNKNYKIGCVINRIGIFEDVITGIKAATKVYSTFGISTVIKETKPFSAQRQLDLIDELTEEHINALVIAPVNDARVADKLNDLIKNGIEVVAITADIAGVNYLAFVGCNHVRAGRVAADLIALMTQGPANVALVAGSLKMLGHNQRIQGFKDVIREKYPYLKLIYVLENQDDDIISYNIVSGLLKEHRDIDVLFLSPVELLAAFGRLRNWAWLQR
jgi:LacI family transcriptional regulator